MTLLSFVALWLAGSAVAPPSRPSATARELVERGLVAQGGRTALQNIRHVQLWGVGNRILREQSERPEGPWFITYEQFEERRDYDLQARVRHASRRGYGTPNWWSDTAWIAAPTLVFVDSLAFNQTARGFAPAGADESQESAALLALSPERVLLTALAAPDLRRGRDTVLHGTMHARALFSFHGFPVSVFLNTSTFLPAAVRFTRTRPASFFWYPWGDVASTYWFDGWTLERGGIHYPRLLTVDTDGGPDFIWHVDRLVINDDKDEDALPVIPDSVVRAAARARRSVDDISIVDASRTARVVAAGIVQLPNNWNVTEIEQQDGIIILEAPMSNDYSERVIDDARRRFPGKRVKAVISTSDSWPHIGGIREYVALGIPVYGLALNRPILTRLLTHPHSLAPDSLAKAPRRSALNLIDQPTTVGTGATAIRLIPLRTATGERQLMVYFPAHRLLYSSDLFSRRANGDFFLPQYLSEAVDVIAAAGVEVDSVFGMHLAPTPWSDVLSALEKAQTGE